MANGTDTPASSFHSANQHAVRVTWDRFEKDPRRFFDEAGRKPVQVFNQDGTHSFTMHSPTPSHCSEAD